jgi:hypothetical protein
MKKYGGSRRVAPPYLTSALDGGEGSDSRPAERVPDTHMTEGWLGVRAGPDAVK